MKVLRRWWCFLFGHKIYMPTAGVEACDRCGECREWGKPSWNEREAFGLALYPWMRVKRDVLERCSRLKEHLLCAQCNKLIRRRVDSRFCSQKCSDDWFPF